MIEFAHAADAATTQASPWVTMLPWIAIFAVMYFLMIRPQQQREKKRQAMINQLKKGDRVLLVSGFYGRVVKPSENVFSIELSKGLTVEVERNAIASKVETPADNTVPASTDEA